MPGNNKRPGTLAEWMNYWGHDSWYSPEKVRELAVDCYLTSYARWVNTRGWRKPPGWTGGHVATEQLVKRTRHIFPEELRRATSSLMRKVADVGSDG